MQAYYPTLFHFFERNMARLTRLRRLKPITAVLVFCLSCSGANAQVETAIAVIGAISTIASLFGPKGGGGNTAILVSIANNIQRINESLQNVTIQLDELKKDVKALPQQVLQNEMAVHITGRLQNTFQSLETLRSSPGPAARESSYRELREYYDAAKNLRSDLFSREMQVAERLALHVPMLYGVELSSFVALNSIDIEDPNNKANYAYYAHESQWRYALGQYAQFYRFSLDANAAGSFANKLRSVERQISDIFSTLGPEYQQRLAQSDEVILTTSFCYYSTWKDKIATGRDCDDTGCTTDYTDVTYYEFAKRTYVFEKNEQGEVTRVEEWDERLADYNDLSNGFVIDTFLSDYSGDCEKVVAPGALKASEALASADIKRLELSFANRNLLRNLRSLGEKMQEQILAEMTLRKRPGDPPINNLRLQNAPQKIGTTIKQ